MELQWKSVFCDYLRCNLRQVQNLEQTLELRLTEGMPDIGRVLWTWGQVCLRGKTWRSDHIGASGGIQVWVLYAPEDGSEPRCVEGWIPLQAKWNLPDSHREGGIRVEMLLRSLDARTLSARKLMVRGCVAILAEALEPAQSEIAVPDELPEEVHVFRRSYPVCLCREVGEKEFTLEETLEQPSVAVRKLLSCRVCPMVNEQTVVGSRVIIRGDVRMELVYMGEDDRLHNHCQEIPFAQFAELQGNFDKEATASVVMAVSDISCDLDNGQIHCNCSLVAQYMIRDICLIELAQDAYSPVRKVKSSVTTLELPLMLDQFVQTLEAEAELPALAESVVDVMCLPDHPVQYRENDTIKMELPAAFHVLYYDTEGNLQTGSADWSGHWQMPAGEGCRAQLSVTCPQQCMASGMNGQIRMTDILELQVQTVSDQSLCMVTSLEVGELLPPDPNRPSLILRRAGELSLWELAKGCGSTVAAIEQANQLTGEPDPDKMLLIPVV